MTYNKPYESVSVAHGTVGRTTGKRDSGKFTCHLQKPTGQFVTEIEGRYVLQYAGHRVIDAIRSGVLHSSPTVSPVGVPGACAHCGTTLTFEYDDHLATVACPDCGPKHIEYPFDPGGFQDRSMQAIETFDRRTKCK
jgi:hypothetical protein